MLLHFWQKNAYIRYYAFICFLLLTACKVCAEQNTTFQNFSNNFNKTIAEVKKLKDSDENTALQKLSTISTYIDKLSLIEQLTFYKFQAELYAEQSRFQLSKDVATFGLELAKQLKTPTILIAELSYTRGFSIESLGDLKLASEDYLNGLGVAQSLNDQQFIAQGLINMGAIYYQTNRYQMSLKVLNEALTIANQLNDEDLQGFINTELGSLYLYLEESEQSLKFYRIAYQHYNNIGKHSYAINALMNIAMNYQESKRYEDAIKVYKEILDKSKEQNDNQLFYNIYMGLSWSNLRKKKSSPETSYQYLSIAEQYLADVEQHSAMLNFLIDKSYVLEALQRYDDALDSLFQAEKLFTSQQKQSNNFTYLSIMGLKAKIYRLLGHYETAYQLESEYTDAYIKLLKNEKLSAVQEVRLKYESEQSELQKKLLKKQASSQVLALLQAETNSQNQQMYFLFIVLIVFVFAWLLYKLVKGQHRLLRSSRTDALTGLTNRRRLIQRGERHLREAKRKGFELSLLMIDIDFFKKINDQYGHKQGDLVLQIIAKLGFNMFRKQDVFARFGGEEFIILLPQTNKEQAVYVAERFRVLIEDHNWQDDGAKISQVTLSIGVTSYKIDQENSKITLTQLIKSADDLLYEAKLQGRNRVCV